MKIRCDWNQFASDSDEGVVVGLHFRFSPFQEFDAGVDEECAKDIDQPMKAVNEGDSCEDKEGAEKEGSDDAPKKGRELGFFRNGEVAEKDGKNEDIVDAEGEFNDIAGKKFHGGGDAQGESDQPTE